MVYDAEGKPVMRGDTIKVKEILDKMEPEQLLQLLQWAVEEGTALDCCFDHEDEKCIQVIVDHVIDTNIHIPKEIRKLILCVVFPYAAVSFDLVSKIIKTSLESSREVLLGQTHREGWTALLYACRTGRHKIVTAHVDLMQDCTEYTGMIKELLLQQDKSGRTALYEACKRGHNEIVSDLLDLLRACTSDEIKQVLVFETKGIQTALNVAVSQINPVPILLIALLAAKYKATRTELNLFAHTREDEKSPFEDVDHQSWEFVLNHMLAKIKTDETKISAREKNIEQLKREGKDVKDDARLNLLNDARKKLKTYTSRLNYLPLIAAEKNKMDRSGYHYEDLVPLHAELMEKYLKYNIDENPENSLSNIFPSFYCHQEENIVYSEAHSLNPLKVIGKSGHLALIKHPYVVIYVDACWASLARYVFYGNVVLYLFYLILLSVFLTTHRFVANRDTEFAESSIQFNRSSETDVVQNVSLDVGKNLSNVGRNSVVLKTEVPLLTEVSRFGAIVLSIIGMLFEVLQMHTKGLKQYLKQNENKADLFLFLSTLVVLAVTFKYVTYDEFIHGFGCVLIFVAGLRGAWMLTRLQVLEVGNGFRMLFSVLGKVFRFGPILLFFILLFAFVYHNLLQNQGPFSKIFYSIMKIMAMTIGEVEFNDLLDEDNVETFKIVGVLVFALFLAIMTISMMNLLIGLAVPSVAMLSKQGQQADFKAKVDIILQYSHMMSWWSKKIHKKTPHQIYRKHSSIQISFKDCIQSRPFKKYLDTLDMEYIELTSAKFRMEKMLEGTIGQIDDIRVENEKINQQVNALTKHNNSMKEQIMKLNSQIESMNKQMDALIKQNENIKAKQKGIEGQYNMLSQQNDNTKKEIMEKNEELYSKLANQQSEMSHMLSQLINKDDV